MAFDPLAPVDPTAPSTTKERIIRFLLNAFVSWATPIVLAGVTAVIAWLSSHVGQIAVIGINPQQLVTGIMSALLIGLLGLCTWLYKVLTSHVVVLQEALKAKGLLNNADGWFGARSLTATVKAINAPGLTISPANLQTAITTAEKDAAPPDPNPVNKV
jgi:energy-converting hydrogenase Eha subunit A